MPERAMEETAAAVKRPAPNLEPALHAHVPAPGVLWDAAGARVPGAPSAVLAIQRAAGNQAVMRMLDVRRPGHPLAGPATAVQRLSEDELDDDVQAIREDELDDDVQRDSAALHEPTDAVIRSAAAEGVRTPATTLPHLDRIQASFGRHSIAHVQAHVGPEATRASRAMNARAYASGTHVVFGGTPDLRTAAHEAAHIVQQQAGVQLSGGIGRAGDAYERHADAVADAVVAGRSAEGLIEPKATRPGNTTMQAMKAPSRSATAPAPEFEREREQYKRNLPESVATTMLALTPAWGLRPQHTIDNRAVGWLPALSAIIQRGKPIETPTYPYMTDYEDILEDRRKKKQFISDSNIAKVWLKDNNGQSLAVSTGESTGSGRPEHSEREALIKATMDLITQTKPEMMEFFTQEQSNFRLDGCKFGKFLKDELKVHSVRIYTERPPCEDTNKELGCRSFLCSFAAPFDDDVKVEFARPLKWYYQEPEATQKSLWGYYLSRIPVTDTWKTNPLSNLQDTYKNRLPPHTDLAEPPFGEEEPANVKALLKNQTNVGEKQEGNYSSLDHNALYKNLERQNNRAATNQQKAQNHPFSIEGLDAVDGMFSKGEFGSENSSFDQFSSTYLKVINQNNDASGILEQINALNKIGTERAPIFTTSGQNNTKSNPYSDSNSRQVSKSLADKGRSNANPLLVPSNLNTSYTKSKNTKLEQYHHTVLPVSHASQSPKLEVMTKKHKVEEPNLAVVEEKIEQGIDEDAYIALLTSVKTGTPKNLEPATYDSDKLLSWLRRNVHSKTYGEENQVGKAILEKTAEFANSEGSAIAGLAKNLEGVDLNPIPPELADELGKLLRPADRTKAWEILCPMYKRLFTSAYANRKRHPNKQ